MMSEGRGGRCLEEGREWCVKGGEGEVFGGRQEVVHEGRE